MSTNKTPNYNLHSWLPQDEFHVTEINENFTKLDASLKAEATAAAQKAAALETSLTAGLSPRPRMVVGSYTGTSAVNYTTPQHITLGFRPKAVLICHKQGFLNETSNRYGGLATDANDLTGAVILEDSGFTVANIKSPNIYVNANGANYCFLAFY